MPDDLGFIQSDNRLSQGVVIGVALGAGGWPDSGCRKAFAVADRKILAALITMMDEPLNVAAAAQGLVQSCQNQIRLHRCRNLPANNAAAIHINDKAVYTNPLHVET